MQRTRWARAALAVSTALLMRLLIIILPFSVRTMAMLMEVSVRPSMVWLMRITLDGQASRDFTARSITPFWM